MWSFLQRLVYTLVVTGIVRIEICLNVYVDTGTSHKYATLCLCAQNAKEREYSGEKERNSYDMKGQCWREDYTANSIPGSSCRCLRNVLLLLMVQ